MEKNKIYLLELNFTTENCIIDTVTFSAAAMLQQDPCTACKRFAIYHSKITFGLISNTYLYIEPSPT